MSQSEELQPQMAPMFYVTTCESRLGENEQRLRVQINNIFVDAKNHALSLIEDVLRRAYYDGLRDGFAQGVAAECEKRAKHVENGHAG